MATIKEIAQLAGVSRGTVDRVINNRGAVNPETADKVLSIMKAVNYTPNLAGKRLAITKKQLKFGFILFDTSKNPFFLDVVDGIESQRGLLDDCGIQLEILYTDLHSPESQVKAIEKMQEMEVDGLAVTAVNHPMIVEKLRELSDKGIPIVTANTDIPDCGRIAYVGSDDFKSGQTAGGLMRMISSESTNVGIVIGSNWILSDKQRTDGFNDRFYFNNPNGNVVGIVENRSDDFVSYKVTTEMLTEHPEINALYLSGAGIHGACRAVYDLGKKGIIKIICHDTPASTCSLIEDGTISATIAQQPFTQGKKPLKILLDYLGMGLEPENEIFYTSIEIKILENLY